MSKKKRQQIWVESRGFSLVEMLMVIAIIGSLSAMGIPMLLNPEHKAKKAARELMGDMQKARISAIRSNQEWAVVFDTANNGYLVCADKGADGSWAGTTDNDIRTRVSFSGYTQGVRYGKGPASTSAEQSGGGFPADFVSYDENVLRFYPRGSASAGEQWVYIAYKDAAYAVGTLETGVVRIKRWSKGAWR